MPKKQQQSFESLVQEAISAGGRPIESLDCSNLPSSTDFFHSIVHRHRVRRYSSFIVPRQAVDSKWPKYSRKFGSAVNLKCDSLGELDVEATKRVGDTAAIHVLDIGDLMSGPRGRAQGGVSAVLIGKCTEELLVEALGTRVSMLANEVDYVVSGMLPLVARTMARLLSIKLHSSKDGSSKKIPMYSVEAILVDNKGTLCSYGISTFVAGSDLHNLPNASIPYFDPAFGPSTEHSVPHSAKSPAFYTPANQPDSVPTYMKPLWNDRNVRHLTNLIPDIVPNPMMFEKDGNRGTFIWGTQFGTEGRHVVGHDGPPSQLTPGGETDTSGLSHRAFTRAFQLLDTRKYYATPEKERKLAMVEGVTTVLLGKGCEHDTVVADRKLGNKEKGEKEIHTGFLFSLTDHICGDTNARLTGGGFTATIYFAYRPSRLLVPSSPVSNKSHLVLRSHIAANEGRKSFVWGSAEEMHVDGPGKVGRVGVKCVGLFVGPKGQTGDVMGWRKVKL